MKEELLLEILNVVKRSEVENKKAIEELKMSVNRLEGKVEKIETRFDGLEEEVEKIETRFDGLEGKVEKVETRFDVLEEKADKLDTKSDRIDAKTDRIEKHIVDEMNDTSQMVNILFGQTGKITNYLGLTWDIKHIN